MWLDMREQDITLLLFWRLRVVVLRLIIPLFPKEMEYYPAI